MLFLKLARFVESTPNIKSKVCYDWIHDLSVCAVRKEFNFSSDGDFSGGKKCRSGYIGACGAIWRSLRE
jgi:hypothetical protein